MCVHPWRIESKDEPFINGSKSLVIPCGRCPECIAKRQSNWVTRFLLEELYQRKANPQSITYFGTLTYNDDHLPTCREDAVRDVQAFIKSLYRNLEKRPRYYITSENGSKHGRLHFHFLLFGVPIYNIDEFRLRIVKKAWSNGYELTRYASGKDLNYVSKYVTKDVDSFNTNSWKTIQSYSKRPALGVPALAGQFGHSISATGNTCWTTPNGFKRSLTRYMVRSLLNETQCILKLNEYERHMPKPYDSSDPDMHFRASESWTRYHRKCREARKKKCANILKFESLANDGSIS